MARLVICTCAAIVVDVLRETASGEDDDRVIFLEFGGFAMRLLV